MFQDMEITPDELVALRESGQSVRLIDVREDWEFEYSRIPGAELLPLHELEFRHSGVLKTDETIVCYCHMGMRSFNAALWLKQNGYERVKSLAGGINRWADERDPEMPRY
ncbi:MAG: rhodanese-like domain-containing protein [Candidatus Eisenbacteria bacterium]|nr:rhodanese-like domain-containing protein [Candidatus Eisenbacteria bacterium]